jgi:penicillin-binding protein 2
MRTKLLKNGVYILFVILGIGLFKIQIVDHEKYRERAEKNSFKTIRIPPIRGNIYDRNGVTLADWIPAFHLLVTSESVPESSLILLENFLNRKIDKDRILSARGTYPLLQDLSFDEVVTLEERADLFPWLFVSPFPKRYYRRGYPLSHVIGYVGEITKRELSKGYFLGDYIGRMGVERAYENILRGKSGYRFFTVNVTGNIVGTDPRPPIPARKGKDISLTIDAELTLFVDSLFMPYRKGALVLMDLKKGDLLVLYSKPGFDPNRLSSGLSKGEWDSLVNSPDTPLLNRAVSGLYPPGSIFKLITALIGLEMGKITKNTRFQPCYGVYNFGKRTFRCWKPDGHGSLDLMGAIEQSCDVYFYQLGLSIGLEPFLEKLKDFELNRKLDIGIPEIKRGFIPDTLWYINRYGRRGYGRGHVINLSIGQGEILLTPLEITVMTGLIARKRIRPPRVVMAIDGEELPLSKSFLSIPVEERNLDIVREAMLLVVEGENGTGKGARVEGIRVAGKTGTAQNPHGEDHALFTAFAPFEDPEVAVTVVVENAGQGGEIAAPIAGKLLSKYFLRRSGNVSSLP